MSRPAALARAEARLEHWVRGTQLAEGRYPVYANAKMDVKQAVMGFLNATPMEEWPDQLPVHLADSRVSPAAMQKVLPDLGLPMKLVVADEMRHEVQHEVPREPGSASWHEAQWEGWRLPEPGSPLARASEPDALWDAGMRNMEMCKAQLDPASGPHSAAFVDRTFIFVRVAAERLAGAMVRMDCSEDQKVAYLMEIDNELTQIGHSCPQLNPQLTRLRGDLYLTYARDLEPQQPGSMKFLERFRGGG